MLKKTLLATLAAATALIPAAALAQDDQRPHRESHGGGRGGNDGGQQHAPRTEAPRPQAQPARQEAPRPDMQRPQADAARPDRQPGSFGRRFGDNPGMQGQGRGGGWRGQPQTNAVPQGQAAAQQQGDPNRRDWRGGGRGAGGGNDQPGTDPRFRGNPGGGGYAGGQPGADPRFRGNPGGGGYDPRAQGNSGWRGTPGGRRPDDGVNRPQDFQAGDRRGNDWNGGNWRENDRRSSGAGTRADRFRGGNPGAWNRGGGNWNRDWRQDRRYDWNRYRVEHRDLFRLPRYYAPYGWNYGYRRFSVGFRLTPLLFAQDYWIDDPFYYQLPPVDGPYRWVRYYNDALLVDIYSGEVVDVVYGIFW